MPEAPSQSRVQDTVPKIEGDIAVGENLQFQRKWWRFERFIWAFFALVLLADLLGLFGRGWLAQAQKHTPDHAVTLKYEWIERASTPSIMTLLFAPSAIHNGHVQVYVSSTIIQSLGAHRIAPEPAVSSIGDGGVTYTFPVTGGNMTMEIALMPQFPGPKHFEIRVPGSAPIRASVFVVP